MLEQIRRGTQSGLSYILVGVLIVFFAVFFGVPADGCRAGDGARVHMATVAGTQIHTEDVRIIQNHYFRSQQRETMDDDYFRRQAEALKVVITVHLLADRAEQMGLRVSDEEFRSYLTDSVRNPEFLRFYGRTGLFHGPGYEEHVLLRLRTPYPNYEEYKRKELLARKYMALLEMQAYVSAEEIQELNELRNTQVNLEYVRFSEDHLVDVLGISDEEIEAFLADPEGQQRVQDYFEDHRDEYEEPARVNLRNIRIFKPSDQDDDAAMAQAEQTFEGARSRVVDQGHDFAEVARETSEDFYRDEGGLMGWNRLDNIDQQMAEAVEDAEVGEIVELETEHAFILVKVEDREEEVVAQLADVQDEIAQILLRQDLVADRGGELADTLHARLQGTALTIDEALTQLAEEAREDERPEDAEMWESLSASTTGFFSLEHQQFQDDMFGGAAFGRAWDEIPGLGQNRELATAAFRLTEDAPLLDEVATLDDAVAVVRLHEREDPEEELDAADWAELAFETRIEKIDVLLGESLIPFGFQVPGLFNNPAAHIGHYAEAVFEQGLADGTVRLFERNSRAAGLLRQMAAEPDDIPEADLEPEGDLLELTEESDE